jgi:hypothetical protein
MIARIGMVPFVCIALALATRLAAAVPANEPAWRIENFCHRQVAADKRCLVRARQGIVTWRIAEMPTAPTTRWHEGIAVLRFAGKSPATVFYAPPNKVAGPFRDMIAVDIAHRRIALRTQPKIVEVRALFDGRVLSRTIFASTPRTIDGSFAEGALTLRTHDAVGRVVRRQIPLANGTVLD